MNINIFEIFGKEYLKEYLSRNKLFIIVAVLILVASVFLGIALGAIIKEELMELLKEIFLSIPENPTVYDEAIFLFQNNIRANTIIMAGGLLFSIFSVLSVILNGIIIGFTSTLISPIKFVVGISPHGIFEIPAIILSLVGAFIITKLEINLLDALIKKSLKEEIRNSGTIFEDIVLTYILIFIFLIFAAIIEAGITPVLLSMV